MAPSHPDKGPAAAVRPGASPRERTSLLPQGRQRVWRPVHPADLPSDDAKATLGEADDSIASTPERSSGVPELAAFDQWLEDYLAADSAERRTALVSSGAALAARRREALKALIETDPEASLRAAVSLTARQKLPASITAQLEEPVEGDGELEVIGALDSSVPGTPRTEIRRSVTLNGQSYRAFVYGRRLTQMSESSLPLHGIAVGDTLAVHEDPVRPMEVGEVPNSTLPVANADGRCPVSGLAVNPIVAVQAGGQIYHLCCGKHVQALNQYLSAQEDARLLPKNRHSKIQTSSSWTTGVKTVLFMRVSYADRSEPSITETAAADLMTPVNTFFVNNSFGLISLQTTISSVLTLPGTVASYTADDRALLDDARQAATRSGYNLDEFDLDCVFCGPGFAWNQAFIGFKGTWLSSQTYGVACHEFGHNLGLYHANAWVTSDGTTLGAGQNREYGNWFDTMGYGSVGPYSFNAFEKHLLGWLPESGVTSPVSNRVYRLYGIDSATLESGNSYALRIPKDNQRDYWIEFRPTQNAPELQNAVPLIWSPWSESNGGSQLLNCNPKLSLHPALQVGQVFYDLEKGLKITPLSVSQTAPRSIEIEVNQVFYLPIEVSWAQANPSAGANAAQPLLQGQFISANGVNSASVAVTVPAEGFYAIWVQTVNSSPAADATAIVVATEAGEVGTAICSSASGLSAWSRVGDSSADLDRDSGPKTFWFSKGDHTLQIGIGADHPQAVRLLITNDSGTELPPALSPVGDQVMLAGSSLAIPFFITAIGQAAADQTVRVSSEDPSLIADTNMVLTTTASQWTLTITASDTQTGVTRVHINVTDDLGRLIDQSFALTVLGRVQALVNSALPGSRVMIPAGISYEHIVVDKDLTLEGAGANQTIIDGHASGPVIIVKTNCRVQLQGMTIRNGRGAGVRNDGTLQLASSWVQQNLGNGIQNRGTLLLEQVVLANNRTGQGAGLDNFASATLRNCTVVSNTVTGGAGGLMNRKSATLICEACCVAGNRAFAGSGGGFQNLGDLTIRNCTICDNLAADASSAEKGRTLWSGGGIANSGRLSLEHSTVCRNQADAGGGGLSNSGQADLANNLIAANSSLSGAAPDCSGTLNSKGHNLIENPAGFSLTGNTTDNILGQDPRLGPLRDNGGPTKTVALLPGSPAIDAGDCALSPAEDQRGMPRPVGLGCDIGAFEYQAPPELSREGDVTHGRLQLQPNMPYIVEATSDLTHWAVLGKYNSSANGWLEFADSASDSASRFYRVRSAITDK
jgi:hypothetical protein